MHAPVQATHDAALSDDQPRPISVTIADQSQISNAHVVVTAAGGDLHSHTPPPEPPLRQLPAPLRDFLGREQEREHLILALGIPAGRTAVIATIQGMGSVGKTALAVTVANRNLAMAAAAYADQLGVDDARTQANQLLGAIQEGDHGKRQE